MSEVFYYDLQSERFLYDEEKQATTQTDAVIILKANFSNLNDFEQKIKNFHEKYCNLKVDKIMYNTKYTSYIYDKEELELVKKLNSFCEKQNCKFELYFDTRTVSTFEQFTIARDEVESFVNKLNSLTIEEDGKQVPLSVAEKFFVIFEYASNRYYNKPSETDIDMRNWIGVLSTDKVICSGFASLVKCLCDRTFSRDELYCVCQPMWFYDAVTLEKEKSGHMANVMYIQDPKYSLKGIRQADACWSRISEEYNQPDVALCLTPLQKRIGSKKLTEYENNFVYYPFNKIYTENERNYYFQKDDYPFEKFLLHKFGYKTYNDFCYEDPEAEINRREQEFLENQPQIIKQYKINFKNFLRNHDIKKYKFKIMEKWNYPFSFREKYPKFGEIVEFFTNKIDFETFASEQKIQELLFYLDEYEKFYISHKKEMDGFFAREFFVYNPKTFLSEKGKESLEVDRHKIVKQIKKDIVGKANAEKQRFLKEKKHLIYGEELPEKLIDNGLKAIAKMKGIENVDEFVKKQKQIKQERDQVLFGSNKNQINIENLKVDFDKSVEDLSC